MKRYLIISTLFTLFVLMSCRQIKSPGANKTTKQSALVSLPTIKPILVDYKSDRYKVSLGENYKISDKIIGWHWAAMADDDGNIDSTGKDAFMNIQEPLIHFNGAEYLPAIHIKTDKNLITSFTCSILFDLGESPSSSAKFLNLMSKDIKKLEIDSIRENIIKNGIFERGTKNYVEIFKLTKANEFLNDEFEYTIKIRAQNGM